MGPVHIHGNAVNGNLEGGLWNACLASRQVGVGMDCFHLVTSTASTLEHTRVSRLARAVVAVDDGHSGSAERQVLVFGNRVDVPHVLHGTQLDVRRRLYPCWDLVCREGFGLAVLGIRNAMRGLEQREKIVLVFRRQSLLGQQARHGITLPRGQPLCPNQYFLQYRHGVPPFVGIVLFLPDVLNI